MPPRPLSRVLSWGDAPVEAASVANEIGDTLRYWRSWSTEYTYDGPYRDQVLRSGLALKLLTYAPSGAIVAAPTAGLPEAVPGERNYDYRFTWLRDASFTVTAFLNLGFRREAAEFIRFLLDVDPSLGVDLRLMYAIDGAVPGETELPHLSGWRGVGPVRIGNAAADQDEYDIYGEFLVALHAYLDAVDYEPGARLKAALPTLVANLAGAIIAARNAPDHGIWELRTEKRQIVHTKAMLWVGLDRAIRIVRETRARGGGTLATAQQVERWSQAATAIRAEYEALGWSAARESYAMSYGSDDLDASVLRAALFGAFDVSTPRFADTLAAIVAGLGDGDLLYRYHIDDGLRGTEATFTACAFWLVGCLALRGDTRGARDAFERLLGRGGELGLFAEEIDAGTGEQRGNFPQGFTHMAVVNHAVRLRECIRRFRLSGSAG